VVVVNLTTRRKPMKRTAVVGSALLVLGSTAVVHAASMVAGPLFPNGVSDSCSCLAVNVTSSARTIDIQVLDKGGLVIASSGPTSIPAGGAEAIHSGVGGAQYCTFVNASSSNFRGTMTCVYNGTDVVAVPAR
jgi:hypothetical protein